MIDRKRVQLVEICKLALEAHKDHFHALACGQSSGVLIPGVKPEKEDYRHVNGRHYQRTQ